MRMKRLAGILLVGAAWVSLACLMVFTSARVEAGGGTGRLVVESQGFIGKVPDSTATASLAPGMSDTSSAVSTLGCDKLVLIGLADGDSFAYYIDYSPDGTNWLSYRDSTFVDGVPTADSLWFSWGDPDTAWTSDTTWSAITRERFEGTPGLKVWHQFVHTATADTNYTVHYGDFVFDYVRLRLLNLDVTDTLRSNDWQIRCKD